jgi:uncharacterized membrane protein
MRDVMLIVHFIGLSMSLGTGFANLFLGMAAAKLEPAERGKFMSKTMILMRMGHTGLGLLLVSGFYMITPYWKVLGEMPVLIAKLCFVGLLVIMVSVITILAKKAQREGNPAMLMKLKPFGMLNFFVGITIVVLAVLSFH